MNKNDFIVAIASALEVEISVITMDVKIDDIPEWDSLGHLTILSYLDDLTEGKAAEIDNLGVMESLNEIWNAFVQAKIGSNS
jgi:hypothetical protein